jgi:hypothetical protein
MGRTCAGPTGIYRCRDSLGDSELIQARDIVSGTFHARYEYRSHRILVSDLKFQSNWRPCYIYGTGGSETLRQHLGNA